MCVVALLASRHARCRYCPWSRMCTGVFMAVGSRLLSPTRLTPLCSRQRGADHALALPMCLRSHCSPSGACASVRMCGRTPFAVALGCCLTQDAASLRYGAGVVHTGCSLVIVASWLPDSVRLGVPLVSVLLGVFGRSALGCFHLHS
jgi:hypothetical protein